MEGAAKVARCDHDPPCLWSDHVNGSCLNGCECPDRCYLRDERRVEPTQKGLFG